MHTVHLAARQSRTAREREPLRPAEGGIACHPLSTKAGRPQLVQQGRNARVGADHGHALGQGVVEQVVVGMGGLVARR